MISMRVLNRVLALVAALAVIVFAVLFTIEVVAAAANKSPAVIHWHSWYKYGQHNRWRDGGPRLISSLLVIIGGVLVIAQLKPRRVSRLLLSKTGTGIDSAMSRRGIIHAVNAAAMSVDGVTRAKTALRRGRAVTSLKVIGSGPDVFSVVRDEVTTAITDRVAELSLRRHLRVQVRARATKEPS